MKNKEPLVALKDTLWKAQIVVDRINFPWLFDPDNPKEKTLAPSSITDETDIPLARVFLNHDSTEETRLRRSPNGPSLERPSPDTHTRVTTPPVGGRYIVPELHDYVWLLDRDPRHKRALDREPAHEGLLDNDPGSEDLLILRVHENGEVLQPIVIFGSADWDDPDFKKILRDEQQRHTSSTKKSFKVNSRGHHYLWKGLFAEPKYFSSGEQFCAILPLNILDYESQCLPSRKKNRLFEPLEMKLGIVDLIRAAEDAYKRWCKCERFYDNISPDMVLCDNVKCSIGWYHRGCVGLDEDLKPGAFWLCDTCDDLPYDQRVSANNMDLEYNTVAERSSYRVQRTRTLSKVWDDHDWPSEADVLETIDEIARNLDIVSNVEIRVPKYRDYQDRAPPSNWVLAKEKPEKLILAVSRGRHLVYHQKITTEESDDSVDNSGDNEDESSDSASTDQIENDLSNISIDSKPIFGGRPDSIKPSGHKNPFDGIKPSRHKNPFDDIKLFGHKNPFNDIKLFRHKNPFDGIKPSRHKKSFDGIKPSGHKKPFNGIKPSGRKNPFDGLKLSGKPF